MKKIFLQTPLSRYLSELFISMLFDWPRLGEIQMGEPQFCSDGKYSYNYYFKESYFDELVNALQEYYINELLHDNIPNENWIKVMTVLMKAETITEIHEKTGNYYMVRRD